MQHVAEWLETLGLAQYAQRFAEDKITISVLRDLTDADLKELGVTALGHRRLLLRAIAELADTEKAVRLLAAAPELQNTAERRQVTVMFSDLVGSTALSARMDPEDLREVISAYQNAVAETVQRFDGFVAKYMGDGVLIYFGYPQAHEDDAERAVRAGLELIAAVSALKAASPLQTRVGIATGLVVVGDLIGSGESQERGIVGETPNFAARLQGIAEPNTVVIAGSTRKLLGNLFELQDLGAKDLKGIAEPVLAWTALRASSVESRFEALRTATTPLVGREEEIGLLMRRWAQAKAGEGSVVLVSGEPGIGKSRIAQTMAERLGGEPHTRLRYFCSPYHQDSALYPSIAQLERAAGFRREDTDEERLDKLEAVLAQGTNDLNQVVPLLADLLSTPTGDRYPPLDLTPQKRKEKTLHAQLAQIEGLAARRPVLIVFEDVHWSDPTSREALDLIIDHVPVLRVLLVITFRPEFTPRWLGRPHVSLLSLNRLPPRHGTEMIGHVTGGKALPKQVANQIVERTDGVPLFIEELTKSVIESGVVTDAGDHFVLAAPLTPLAIPTSLHASLLARLDRLAPIREIAQIGAALGRSFSHDLIDAVAATPQQLLDDALEQLVRGELIFRRGTPPAAEYTFKHALVQDAAYSTLLRSRRQQLHCRIAAALETQFPEMVAAQPQVMAQHCAEGGLAEKAINHWLKAGQQAASRSAMAEAAAHLQKGLDALAGFPDSPQRQQKELELLFAILPALIATEGFAASKFGEINGRARALAEHLDRSDYFLQLAIGEWIFHDVRAEYRTALGLAERTEKFGARRNDFVTLSWAKSMVGYTRFFLGEFVAARASYEQCQGSRDPRNDAVYAARMVDDPHVSNESWLALALTYLGYIDEGRTKMDQALAAARRAGKVQWLASVLAHACWMGWLVRSTDKVQQGRTEELLALMNEHGFPHWSGWGMLHRGWLLTALGHAKEGLILLEKGLASVRDTGAVMSTPYALIMLAEAQIGLGKLIDARNSLAEAGRIIDATEERCNEAELYRSLGNLSNAAGDQAAAEQNYRRAFAVAARQSAKALELRAATSLARLWREQSKHTEARDLLAPVRRWFTEGLDAPVLQEAQALLDEVS